MTQAPNGQAERPSVAIEVKVGDILREPSELAMLATYEDATLPPEITGLFEAKDFSGKAKQSLLLYPRGAVAPQRLLLIGLGKRDAERDPLTPESVRQEAARAVRRAKELRVAAFTLGIDGNVPLDPEVVGQAFAEGIELGVYRYWQYRTNLTDAEKFAVERVTVFTSAEREQALRTGFEAGWTISRGQMLVRDLVNCPPLRHEPGQARRGGRGGGSAARAHGDGLQRG